MIITCFYFPDGWIFPPFNMDDWMLVLQIRTFGKSNMFFAEGMWCVRCFFPLLFKNRASKGDDKLSIDQNPGYLLYIGDEILPSYTGIIVSHYGSGSLLSNQSNGRRVLITAQLKKTFIEIHVGPFAWRGDIDKI